MYTEVLHRKGAFTQSAAKFATYCADFAVELLWIFYCHSFIVDLRAECTLMLVGAVKKHVFLCQRVCSESKGA